MALCHVSENAQQPHFKIIVERPFSLVNSYTELIGLVTAVIKPLKLVSVSQVFALNFERQLQTDRRYVALVY